MKKNIYVVSGPSGVGKTSIVLEALKNRNDIVQVISHTTRKIRNNEIDGVHYNFISLEEFISKEKQGDFVESAEVLGNKYGVSKTYIEKTIQDKHAILVINWRGYIKIKKMFPNNTIGIFISPPSIDELKKRIIGRSTDSKTEIEKRLQMAQEDLKYAKIYDFEIINNDLSKAVNQFNNIISNLSL